MLSGDIPPNQTIYIKNLNEKVKKEGDSLLAFHLILLYSFRKCVFFCSLSRNLSIIEVIFGTFYLYHFAFGFPGKRGGLFGKVGFVFMTAFNISYDAYSNDSRRLTISVEI